MNKNTAIITVIVAAIIIGGGATYILINRDSGEDPYANLKMVSLPVYGNANSDYTIDSNDVDLINELIGDETRWGDYPYADADGDGSITDADAKIVEKLINGESTKVRFVDQYYYDTGKKHVVEVDYPLDHVVTINPDMTQLTFVIDGDKKVAGYIANQDSYVNTFYKIDNNGVSVCLGTTPRTIGASEWAALKDKDAELNKSGQGIGAVLAYNDAALGDYKDDLDAVGIPVIYIRCTDPIYSIDGTLLLGFLFGPEYSKKAMDYSNDSRKAIVDVTDKVAAVSESDRTRFIALCMWKYMSQHDSQYTKIGIQAGGTDMANLPGNGSDPIEDVEAITKYNGKIDYIMNCRTCDCKNVDTVAMWEDSRLDIIKKSTEFKNMFFLNMSLPTPCRVMYAAAVFYPDIVSMNDAHKYFQTMVDKYLPYLNDTVSDKEFNVTQDMTTISTYQDYVNAKGGDTTTEVDSDIQIMPLAERFYSIMADDLSALNYSYKPYGVSPDNTSQVAKVSSSGDTYYMKYWLSEDAKGDYERLKAVYEAKVGTVARVGGICTQIPYTNGLTESYGYYVNSDRDESDPTKLGSINWSGYYKELVVELHIAIRPGFEMSQIEKLIGAAFPSESAVDAADWAESIDVSSLSSYKGAPFSIVDGASALAATISDTDDKRYISFDSSGTAFVSYHAQKKVLSEKAEGYVGQDGFALMGVEGFDESYGYIVYRTNGGGFYMLYFIGLSDGCFLDISLRIDGAISSYSVETANALATSILGSKP